MTDYEVIKAMLERNGIGFAEKLGVSLKYIECEAGYHGSVIGYSGAKMTFVFDNEDGSLTQLEAQDS